MKHRIFVSLGLPKDLQEEILKWEKKLEILPVRWTAGKNMHITLAPPWEEIDWTHAASKLEIVRSEPFILRFHKVSFGPDPRKPRLIWAEGEPSPELAALRENIRAVLGLEIERQPFKSHITLARFQPESFKTFPMRKLEERVSWEFEVNSILIMESKLLPEGADYEVLQELPLAHQ